MRDSNRSGEFQGGNWWVAGALRFRASARVEVSAKTKAGDVAEEKGVAVAEAIASKCVLDVVVRRIDGVNIRGA